MPTLSVGGVCAGVEDGLSIVAADVLALRGAGLEAAETWALLCQAAQALQDLFLSNGGVVDGSRAGPVVTPNTLELTPRGRVALLQAPPETARAYLPPEYRPGRVYSDTDSEKMWMYSLGRALLDTTPRVTALTGTVSVSPSCALQSVLAAMTEPDPRRRASLMNLLDVISEYCRSRLQSRPFTHIVMDMYREVVCSPQYAARKRVILRTTNKNNSPSMEMKHKQSRQYQRWSANHRFAKYNNSKADNSLFKIQSRNSRSHPNLMGLSTRNEENPIARFQSQLDMINAAEMLDHPSIAFSHLRTVSQPLTMPPHQIQSNGDLIERKISNNITEYHRYQRNRRNGLLEMPPPMKPFLSSQDVRYGGCGLSKLVQDQDQLYARPMNGRRNNFTCFSSSSSSTSSLRPNGIQQKEPTYETLVNAPKEEIYASAETTGNTRPRVVLHQQVSNNRLSNLNQDINNETISNPLIPKSISEHLRIRIGNLNGQQQKIQEYCRNPVPSDNIPDIYGTVPSKIPRIITSLKKDRDSPNQPISDGENGIPIETAPRVNLKNGPRARRGKPVQRAPSRLYRAIGGQMRNFNKTQCVGPEFVIRANQPSKIMTVGDIKSVNSSRLVVIMLTGQRLEVTCDPQKITAGELFQAIVQAEGLDENFTLGLAALLAGDFALLPPDTKLNKVAPPGWLNTGKSKGLLGLPASFMLYLRLRFFLPSLRGIRSWTSKHLLYLQIRRCILEQQLVCPLTQLINLTGLALQAEFGNYSVNEHGCADYFLLEHYIPEALILNPDHDQQYNDLSSNAENLKRQLHQAHRDRRGLDTNKAEEMFITHAQNLIDFGSHYYIATVDAKELSKIISRQRKINERTSPVGRTCTEDIYAQLKRNCPALSADGKTMEPYTDEEKIILARNPIINDDMICNSLATSGKESVEIVNNNNSNNNNNCNNSNSKLKKTESAVWLAIHGEGLKLFERGGGRFRERKELARFQWRDIQTLSYSKSCLVIYTKVNGKRCKFKLRMDHRKSYFAFKLTSLHHQFFLKLRSEISSLQGLAKDFGVPLVIEPNSPKAKPESGKTKISIANAIKKQEPESRLKYPFQLEEYQNKENENPQKDLCNWPMNNQVTTTTSPICSSPDEDVLYAQVNTRLEPEGESRDTEDESDRDGCSAIRNQAISRILNGPKVLSAIEDQIYGYANVGRAHNEEYVYCIPKLIYSSAIERLEVKSEKPEDIYAAVNKNRTPKKNSLPVPEEVWDVSDIKESLNKAKTSSLPNYGTPKSRQSSGFRTPSLPRRLGVKMGTRAIYSSSNMSQKDISLADDLESLSLKSDTASSMQSTPARSVESPMPEAYVLNADIRTANETFRIQDEETMSSSLVARFEEMSFTEERILHVIKLERGNGGSIGLQVTEGNDGGVYVQAVSVGGSADMTGNINKGDRVVAINGQTLMNLGYEHALKLLQSSSETVELVLSRAASNRVENHKNFHRIQQNDANYLQSIRFNVSSETDYWNMSSKWLGNEKSDVKNHWDSHNSSTSTTIENYPVNETYTIANKIDPYALQSASILVSLEDLDVSRTSQQVFI
ncbi:uncharacterized protein LOC127285907 isoform X2 [Leptopilina boulardi]|nr:uncharacterized protein LOC127285907 isoform X2 [Leptopilina boulardi]XP_051168072.1 uncharacterized protein LOC127285907 isoform X2 [Leptopilina boulardi]XP_051168073.1 uncharacterized protein LOC127285907 isoform X2 [Leptopilina boulardi]